MCENVTCADEAKCYVVSDEHITDHIYPYCVGELLVALCGLYLAVILLAHYPLIKL